MATLPELATQYNIYTALVPIGSSGEVRSNNRYRVIGTIEDFQPYDGRLTTQWMESQSDAFKGHISGVFNGNISLDYIVQNTANESVGSIVAVAHFKGENGERDYNHFNELLTSVKKAGLMKKSYTDEELEDLKEIGLMGEKLNETGVFWIGIKTRGIDQNIVLYSLIGDPNRLVRGPNKGDSLQRFNYDGALEQGLIKLPKKTEEE